MADRVQIGAAFLRLWELGTAPRSIVDDVSVPALRRQARLRGLTLQQHTKTDYMGRKTVYLTVVGADGLISRKVIENA